MTYTRDKKGRFTFSDKPTPSQQKILDRFGAKNVDQVKDAYLAGYDNGVRLKSRYSRGESLKNWLALKNNVLQ